jgi:hypothetical protein
MTMTRFVPFRSGLSDVAVLQNRLNSIFNDFARPQGELDPGTESLATGNFLPANGNPEVLPMHLLAALLEDREGVVLPVLEGAGVRVQELLAGVNAAISKLPKVSGGRAARHVPRAAKCSTAPPKRPTTSRMSTSPPSTCCSP